MSLKILKPLMAGVVLSYVSFAAPANAAIFTFGNLSSASDGNVITDTSLGREYLRFDEYNLSYADTHAAVATGGSLEGWSIATLEINFDFLDALLAPVSNGCTSANSISHKECGTVSGWADAIFGDSYSSGSDYFAYTKTSLGNTDSNTMIGMSQIRSDGTVAVNQNWFARWQLDDHNVVGAGAINLLLYRTAAVAAPTQTVPEPAPLALLGFGLLGLGLLRKRKA